MQSAAVLKDGTDVDGRDGRGRTWTDGTDVDGRDGRGRTWTDWTDADGRGRTGRIHFRITFWEPFHFTVLFKTK